MATFTGTDGDDLITPDAVSPGVTSDGGATPDAIIGDEIDAGAGNDTIDGGGAVGDRDIVDGETGNDLILSADGTLAFGSEGDDTLIGATNDVLFGDEGNDRLVAGDSTRAFGGDGDDTFIIPTDIGGAELHGDDGNDTFLASAGNNEIHGDAGDDVTIWTMTTPQTSNSLIDGGDGDDTFKVVLIQDDHAATIELANDGEGFDDVHIVREFPWPTDQNTDAELFVQNTEHIQVVSGQGADNIVVQDQTGLGVQTIDIDVGGAAAGGPDGQRDVVSLEGTGDADHAAVTTVAGGLVVAGLGGVTVTVTDLDHSGGVSDQVLVATGAGDDSFDLSLGADRAQLATLTIDGGDGSDSVNLAGGTTGEAYVLTQVDGAAVVTVGGAQVAQLENVETLNIATGGGGDSVLINDLEGSGVTAVNVDLAGAVAGQADGVHDRVTFEDAGAPDQIVVFQSDDGRSVTAGSGTTQISVTNLDNQDQVIFHGNDGDDTIVADGAASVAQITLNGNGGDDLVIGGKGTEFLFGEAGNDTLQGGSGRNIMDGGDGNDMIVNADGSIGVGGTGDDTLLGATNDVIQAGDGDDRIVLGLSTQATGGAGNDTFISTGRGGNGSTSEGGDGADSFAGDGGNLVFHGGAGDDTMVWAMGADISSNTELSGNDGTDSLTITGPQDATSWNITAGNNGTGFETIAMNHAGLLAKLFSKDTETISFGGGRGADTITVNDQTGLGNQQMNIDLGAAVTGGPDGAHDLLTLNATASADQVSVSTTLSGDLKVSGLPNTVTAHDIDASATVRDSVVIATGAGDDTVDLSGVSLAQLGDITVDGGAGVDAVTLAGSTGGEAIALSSNAGHASVTLGGAAVGDLTNVETLNLRTFGGGDTVVVNDLSATQLTTVNIDLAGVTAGQADGVHDRVQIEDSSASNLITVSQSADGRSVSITEGAVTTNVTDLDNQDQVIIHGNDGNDTISASGSANVSQITLNANGGDDLVIGGKGAENLFGEAGNDTLQGGSGRNVLNGGDGNDMIVNADGSIGQGGAGDDTILGATNDVIQAGDGDDRITAGLSTQVFGEAGNDTILAGHGTANGAQIDAGDGNDVFLGQAGNLVFHGGNGDDTMLWQMSGDISSNTELEGGAGNDTASIDGSAVASAQTVSIGNNGTGFELVQTNTAGLTAKLFMQNTETINVVTGAGADNVTVADQTGLGVQALNIATGAGDDHVDVSAAGDFGGVVTVDGGAGDDTIVGGAGHDIFVFHSDASHDLVTGFHTGDEVSLVGFGGSFDDLVAGGHIVQVGSDVVISDDAGTTVTLAGVDIHNLSASDFLFG